MSSELARSSVRCWRARARAGRGGAGRASQMTEADPRQERQSLVQGIWLQRVSSSGSRKSANTSEGDSRQKAASSSAPAQTQAGSTRARARARSSSTRSGPEAIASETTAFYYNLAKNIGDGKCEATPYPPATLRARAKIQYFSFPRTLCKRTLANRGPRLHSLTGLSFLPPLIHVCHSPPSSPIAVPSARFSLAPISHFAFVIHCLASSRPRARARCRFCAPRCPFCRAGGRR